MFELTVTRTVVYDKWALSLLSRPVTRTLTFEMNTMTVSAEESPQLRADARRNVARILEAAEAGLGRVTIYGHFASRQVLVEAVVRRVLDVANTALNEVDLSGDPVAAFERLVKASWQVTLRSGSVIVAADKALPATTVRQAHAGGLEERVQNLITDGQRSGAFRSDLSADWLIATFHAVLHAAAEEIDAGRLDSAEAAGVITNTMLSVLQAQPTSA